jgi:hypothetical protein
VPDLDKERPYDIPLVRPPPNSPPSLPEEDESVFLINFNKGEDDEGCLKFGNILKWSATVYLL